MNTYDCILAAVLLTSPIESEELVPHLEMMQPTFLQLAIDAEILDAREEQFLQGLSKDLAGDYKALRSRFESLQSAPLLAEFARFPERQLLEDFLAFNRAYRKDVLTRLEYAPTYADELQNTLHEVDQLYLVWSTLRDARCAFYYVSVRRQSVQHVRELVGAEAFYRGELPPHVPLAYFPRLK